MSKRGSRGRYDLNNICRVCLTQSSQSYNDLNSPLNAKYDDSPLIFEALQYVAGERIPKVEGHASGICAMCLSLLDIAYDFKRRYFQNKEKFVTNLASLRNSRVISLYESNRFPLKNVSFKGNCKKTANVAVQTEIIEVQTPENELPDVELVLGEESYDLKSILVVEEPQIERNSTEFHGFLQNLGSVVSATIAGKNSSPKTISKTRSEIEITPLSEFVDIENLEPLQELTSEPLKMSYVCRHCKESFSSASYIKIHIPICEKFHNLQCYVCDEKKANLKDLIVHIRRKHSVVKNLADPSLKAHEDNLKCKVCNKVLANMKRLKYHMQLHGEKKHICEICGRKFILPYKLLLHIQCVHKKETVEVCPVCSKTFHYRGALSSHMKLHSKKMAYQCKFCDKKFRFHYGKTRHERLHTGERPYACNYCPKRFGGYGDWQKHERSLHTGVKPYKCKLCKASYASADNLKVHMFQHKGAFECYLCDRGFVNLEVLKFHLRRKHKITDEDPQENMEETAEVGEEANNEQFVVSSEYMDHEYLSNPI